MSMISLGAGVSMLVVRSTELSNSRTALHAGISAIRFSLERVQQVRTCDSMAGNPPATSRLLTRWRWSSRESRPKNQTRTIKPASAASLINLGTVTPPKFVSMATDWLS